MQTGWFGTSFNLKGMFIQVLLFLGAAAALALFYLSYRPEDFTKAFIVTGMILTMPWLFISLLPALFVLDDKELRREIIGSQLIMIFTVLVLLFGLAVYIDFHWVIIGYIKRSLLASISFISEYFSIFTGWLKVTAQVLTNFINQTIIPFFSQWF
jgi:hypothetical protein